MNNEQETEQTDYPVLTVNEEMRSHIYEMAKWANFLAIFGFVITFLMVFFAFGIGTAIKTNPEIAAMFGKLGASGGNALTIVFMLYALAIFYPSLLMFLTAKQAKLGVLYGEEKSLTDAFGRLKSLFKYWGIVAIMLIGLYALSIVTMIFGG